MSELSPDEIEFLRGFANGLCNYAVPRYEIGKVAAQNLAQMSGWDSSLAGAIISVAQLSPYATSLRQIAIDLGSQTARLRELAEGQDLKAMTNGLNSEIGAMKSHVDQAVAQINEALQSVQSVLDELKEQKELLEIARVADTDPLYGTM